MKTNSVYNIHYDLCVIGSGPAGIIVALEYSTLNPEKRVLLVEYGSKNQGYKNDLDDSIIIKNPLNHHDPYECTNKGLGGTSTTWGGRCVMYDEIDFIKRPIIGDHCTWDIDLFDEINNYISKAATYFECGNSIFNLNNLPNFNKKRIAEGFKEGIVTDSTIERWSKPTRFGKKYVNEIANRKNLILLQGYEAKEFLSPNENGEVNTLIIKEVFGKRIQKIKAKSYVIAAGTQESTRILLRNPQLFNNLDTPPKALGKYYQGHLSGKIASVRFYGKANKTDYSFLRDSDGTYIRRRFQFSTKFLLEQNLLNTAIWLDNPHYHNPKHKSGAMSFMYLAMITPFLGKKLAPPAIAHSVTKGQVTSVWQHIKNIILDLPKSLLIPASIFIKRYLKKRKLPGVFLFNPENQYALHFHSEQLPLSANKMELEPDGEKLIIHYSLTDEDINSVIKVHEALDQWLRDCQCGELEYWYPKSELHNVIRSMSRDGIHQSGTTRIADSPEEGVVDRNLKLWGTKNVFICSSSVFPTSGQANPTFMLGSFAVRLAHHLKMVLQESQIRQKKELLIEI